MKKTFKRFFFRAAACAEVKSENKNLGKAIALLLVILFCFFDRTGAQCPTNIDFETGGLVTTPGWSYFRGYYAGGGTYSLTSTPPVNGLHTLTNTTDPVDAYGGFPTVGVGAHSIKIGHDTASSNADRIRYFIHVPSSGSYSLIYRDAIVLEPNHPSGSVESRFEIAAVDSTTGVPVSCDQHSYIATPLPPGFLLSPVLSTIAGGSVYYKPWTTGNIKFYGVAGRTIQLDVTAAACSYGGHIGYGYFDMSCGLFANQITTCGAPVTLSGPDGYASYQWYDAATYTPRGSTQVVVISSPTVTTTYAVVLTPYTGYGCTDTLFTQVVYTVTPVAAITGPTTVCPGNTITLSDATPGGTWSSGNPSIATVGSTGIVAGLSAGSVIISYGVTSGGCTGYATAWINVGSAIITTIAGGGGSLGDGGPATAAQLTLPTTVFVDGANNKYVADFGGSRVRLINSSGTISTFAGTGVASYGGDGFAATAALVNAPAGVCKDATGNVYIAEQNGCRIRKVNTAGIISTICGNGTCSSTGDGTPATAATVNHPTGISIDPSGNIYIAEWGGGFVRRIDPSGVISRVAGGGGVLGDGGPATAAQLAGPYAISLDGLGNLYISDQNHARIRLVNLSSGIISTVVGTGIPGFSGDNNPATAAQLNASTGVYADQYNLYVADGNNQRIRKVNLTTGIITTIAGAGAPTFSGDGGPAASATMHTPAGVMLDANGNIFIADYTNARVREVILVNPSVAPVSGTSSLCQNVPVLFTDATPGGTWTSSSPLIATVGSASGLVNGVAAGTATITYTVQFSCGSLYSIKTVTVNSFDAGILTGPNIVCVGNIITLTDPVSGGTWSSTNTSIITVSGGVVTGVAAGAAGISYSITNGCGTVAATAWITVGNPIITTIAGRGATLGDGGPATAAQMMWPTTLIVDPSDNILVTDYNAHRVRQITPGGIISTIIGTGIAGSTGDGGPATNARVSGPAGICEDASGNIYVAEQNGCRVRKINTSGVISTICGNGVCSSSGDGLPATAARVNGPTNVVTDAAGNIYISEWNGGLVRKINTSGIISTIAGGGAVVGNGGPATAAQLISPYGLSLDGLGNLFIAEENARRVRVVSLATGIINLYAGTGAAGYTGDNGPATAATFALMGDVFATPYNVYIAEGNSVLRMVNRPTGIITTIVGTGTIGFSGDGGSPASASCNNVSCATFDASGNLYVAEAGNHCIRKIAPVNSTVPPISGPTTVCVGSTITLTDFASGGTWTSSNPAVATIGSTGIVTGISPGVTTITYPVTFQCGVVAAVQTVTVNPLPATPGPITGPSVVCIGASILLSDGVGGGVWTSTAPTVATIGSSSGTVFGLTVGTTTISYTIANSCGTLAATALVTVNPASGTISGSSNICQGASTTLTGSPLGGTWSSSTITVATIGTTGTVFGAGAGTTTITYTYNGGCTVLFPMTVNPQPGPITGVPVVCTGATTTLSDGSGGSWTSGNIIVATVGSGTGIVSGLSAGTVGITYTLSTGCATNITVTVNNSPAAITPPGPVSVCAGSNTTLADASPGGLWSSGAVTIATVLGGTVTGVSAGTATISYTNGVGCSAIKVVTVLITPAAISPGAAAVCIGNAVTLVDGTSGGSWSASNTNATVAGGIVTGVSAGTDIISYTIGSCFATAQVTVNANPVSITPPGPVALCAGTFTTLADGSPGGTWSSGATGIATVISGGIVNGVSAGVANISYTNSAGCSAIKPVTVNTAPGAISPASPTVCTGNTITLSDATGGGSWTSSNAAVASVGSGTGIVTGVSVGTATITYTLGTCTAITQVTVNLSPLAGTISGPTIGCTGTTITLTDGASGGTWSSSNTGIATVGATTGIVTGVTVGTVTISYSVTNGCGTARATYTVSINASPTTGTIVGLSMLCAGTYTVLTDPVPGGIWSSSNTNASIGSATGLLTGIAVGMDTISYRVTNSCGTATATKYITVGPYLTAGIISGASSVCAGSSTVLTDPVPAGVWSHRNAHTSITATGIVGGLSTGVDTISYTVTSGCGSAVATKTLTVIPIPNGGTIIGTASLCVGSVVTYTNASTGGVWSVTNSRASITSTGTLTALSSGTDTIKYTVTNSCGTSVATKIITIGAVVSAGTISGPATVCGGATITLTDPVSGGVWSSRNAHATVGSTTGIVTGVSGGVDTISYTVTASCGSVAATKIVTVNPAPFAGVITGPTGVCIGAFGTYTVTATGGFWGITNSHATISLSGVVTPVSAGRDTVKYTMTNSCGTAVATLPITIGTAVSVGPISGPATVCIGSSVPLTDPSVGGVWSSSNAHATVGTTGIVTGVTTGVDTIRYTITGTCNTAIASTTLTVSPAPVAGTIVGPSVICIGSTATYTDAAPGGIWSLTNPHATVSSTGVVTPVSAGTDTLRYTVTGSCGSIAAMFILTINTAVTAGTISGPGAICIGTPITLTDAVPGGTWSSSNAHATVGTTGVVTGVTAGVDTISYTVSGSCGTAVATTTVTVSAAPVAGVIVGPSTICVGGFTIYTDAAPGGTWSMSNIHASITGAGVLTAVSAGLDTIMYTVTNGCGSAMATKIVNITSVLTAGTISGPSTICIGSPGTLTDHIAGGVWSSSNSNASVSSGGVVTGLAVGTVTISYTVTSSCGTAVATYVITIGSSTGAGIISGPSNVCVGSLITLTETVSGGAWSSSNTHATITTSGVVTGITPGTDTISYTISSSCGISATTKIITINAASTAGVISGPTSVCAGAVITLTNSISGGTWSSSNTNASVNTAGVVTGIIGGTDIISYTVTGICGTAVATYPITINPLPSPGVITGFDSVCIGSTTTLTDLTPGGVWTSGNPNATVSASGVVTGVSAGTAPISYTVTNSCGSVSAVMVITVLPPAGASLISGPSSVCIGSGITLTDPVPGGTWLASNATAMIVGPGIVDGISVGIDTIYYSVSGLCGSATALKIISVNPVPVVPPITGPVSQFVGTFVTMSDALPGGVWTSSAPTVATIGMGSGIVNGVSAGTTIITYTVTSSLGCPGSVTVLHNVSGAGMPVLAGKTTVCTGAIVVLGSSANGGTWASSDPEIATVNNGVVTGRTPGNATISYTVTDGPGVDVATTAITVLPLPVAGTITGPATIEPGKTLMLANDVTGGLWSTNDATIATVSNGMVTALTSGNVVIIYTVISECGSVFATHAMAVSPSASTMVNTVADASAAELKVFPNPNKGIFTMNLVSGSNEQVTVVITDAAGRIVKEFSTVTNKATEIKMDNATGIYLLKVSAGNNNYIQKIIVE
jgi:uncharacterized protein YjdB